MKLDRALAWKFYAFAQFGLPFPLRKPRTTIERLRLRSLRSRFERRKHPWQRKCLFLFFTCSYPFAIGFETWRNLSFLKQSHPEAGLGEWLRMYWLSLANNVPPVEYVLYGFIDRKQKAMANQYLYWIDGPAVQDLNTLRGANNEDVQDKARFASICSKHGLAHVEYLGIFRRGDAGPGLDVLSAEDLWVKPLSLSGSEGAELWSKRSDGYQASGGRVLTREELYEQLSKGDFLLQQRLKNHPALSEMTDGRIMTLRVITAFGRNGEVTLLGNYLLLPTGPGLTTTGGTAVCLRWEDGRMLRRLGQPGLRPEELGETGDVIPFFAEAVELCRRAHATAFQRFVTLGWDVVFTPEGPALLETNSGWGTLELQQLWGPIGLTSLPSLVEQEWASAKSRRLV
jgi:hypothetical protein